VIVGVQASADGAPINLAIPPRFAFLADDDNPAEDEWLPGEWAPDGRAHILIGPAGGEITLTAATYWIWTTWAAGIEAPVYRSGRLRIY